MKCPICGNEMEKGRVNATGGNAFYSSLDWYKEDDCKRSFIKKPFLYPKCSHIFSNFSTRKDLPAGYYCCNCRKIVAVLDVNSSDYYPEYEVNSDDIASDTCPQVLCPKCGEMYDFDYPECPYCKHSNIQ